MPEEGHKFVSRTFGANPERDAISYYTQCPRDQMGHLFRRSTTIPGVENKEEFLPWVCTKRTFSDSGNDVLSRIFIAVQG